MHTLFSDITSSATKIVFIIMAIWLVTLTFIGKIEPKDFLMIVTMVFGSYYTKTGNNSNSSVDSINTNEQK